jgi:hypothetical protein
MKNPLIKVPLKYGAIGAFVMIVLFLVIYMLGDNPLFAENVIDKVLLALFLFSAIREFRDVHNGKIMFFWEGMTVGFFCYIVIASILGVFTWMFLEYYDCNLLADFVTNALESAESEKVETIKDVGQESYDEMIRSISATGTIKISFEAFLQKTVFGLLFTIILSMILRTKPKN